MIETREQERRIEQYAAAGDSVKIDVLPALAIVLENVTDPHVAREIVLPDGTRFVEARDAG